MGAVERTIAYPRLKVFENIFIIFGCIIELTAYSIITTTLHF